MNQPKIFTRICYLIAITAFSIIIARLIWPKLNFDSISLILFGIGIFLILLPYLPITKVKFGDFEAELDTAIQKLEQKVIKSEESVSQKPLNAFATVKHTHEPNWPDYFQRYVRIISSNSSNIDKVLASSILIDSMLFSTGEALGIPKEVLKKGSRAILGELSKMGVISPEEQDAFWEFWEIRNFIIHGKPAGLSDEQTARFLDLASRLVKTLV